MDTNKDAETLALQIGRPLRAASTVVNCCALSLPVVAEVPPVLDGGEPFPTLYWLTCPLAHRRIARLEAAGGVREVDEFVKTDSVFAARLADAHTRYATKRDSLVGSDVTLRPTGGIAGAKGNGVKCLHAHFADHAAGNDNPVGELVARKIGTLNCKHPCVAPVDDTLAKNPRWVEPLVELSP